MNVTGNVTMLYRAKKTICWNDKQTDTPRLLSLRIVAMCTFMWISLTSITRVKQSVKFPSATLLLVYTTTQKVAKNVESRSVLMGSQPLAIRTMDPKPLGHSNVESGSIYIETNGLWNCDSLGKGNTLPSQFHILICQSFVLRWQMITISEAYIPIRLSVWKYGYFVRKCYLPLGSWLRQGRYSSNQGRSLFTYLLTPWCRVLLEKLTGLQLVKKFPTFHGTRKFITALTTVRHLSLSWASPIQSIQGRSYER